MKHRRPPAQIVTALAVAAVTLAALAAAASAHAQAASPHRNVTAGGPLRPGVYGRIEVRGAPPPVIYGRPVIANQSFVPASAQPVYLYVPPGQVRKWKQHCARWSACDDAVMFVRMDESPSRWGKWRHHRDQVALGADRRD
jgi:hypothetical protein